MFINKSMIMITASILHTKITNTKIEVDYVTSVEREREMCRLWNLVSWLLLVDI